MQRHAPTALLIDGMGTLVTLAAPAPLLVDELERRFGVSVSESEAQRALLAEIAYYRAHMAQGRDAESLSDLRRRCAGVLRDALPAAVAELDLVDALLASLRFAPFADARRVLVSARQAGARVVVVSNWDVSLIEVLERLGLAPLLDGVLTSAAVGAAKPAAAIFEQALALAGVRADRARHVGDSLQEDVAGARACGIEAVWLRRTASGPPISPPAGVHVIGSLDDLAWP